MSEVAVLSPICSHEFLATAVSSAAALLAAADARLDDDGADRAHRTVAEASWVSSVLGDSALLMAAVTDVTNRVHANVLTPSDVATMQDALWRLRLLLENAPPGW